MRRSDSIDQREQDICDVGLYLVSILHEVGDAWSMGCGYLIHLIHVLDLLLSSSLSTECLSRPG